MTRPKMPTKISQCNRAQRVLNGSASLYTTFLSMSRRALFLRGNNASLMASFACRLERDIGLQLAAEEANMKYFPASNDSREVRDRLVAACIGRGVTITCNASVEALTQLPGGGGWRCQLADSSARDADRLVSHQHGHCTLLGHSLWVLCQACSTHMAGNLQKHTEIG